MNTHDLDFRPFADAVAKQFEMITSLPFVLRTTTDTEDLWETYLNSFPAGTNEIFRERRHHDGSYDRNFVRRLGNVIGITKEGQIHTIWGFHDNTVDPVYREIAGILDKIVREHEILEYFSEADKKIGYEETIELLADSGSITWNHFYAYIPKHLHELSTVSKEARTTIEMYERARAEFNEHVINTTISLIVDSDLYRGTEYLHIVKQFADMVLIDNSKSEYLFTVVAPNPGVARIRNTAIGTLMSDIAEGMDIETAVFRFESKMDPTKYKRPRAIVTQRMIDDALKTIKKLGYEDSLQRRHATLADIPVTEVIWANGAAQNKMKGGIQEISDLLASKAVVSTDKAETMSFDAFSKDILPTAKSLELLVANNQTNNMFTLIAPVNPDAKVITKWGNNLTWSYAGEVTDSIVERVKHAGGKVDGALRVSLAWSNPDDLDLHCFVTGKRGQRNHIYFGSKQNVLDVDMNAFGQKSDTEPVENMIFSSMPVDGVYRFCVDNYSRRSTSRIGFQLQLAHNGTVSNFTYPDNYVTHGDNIGIELRIENGKVISVQANKMTEDSAPKSFAGVFTNTFLPVDTVMNSPNHWDGYQSGNKHVFFVITDCKNTSSVRGFYNEFLNSDLEKHRRVFELLGSSMQVEHSDQQVAGFGFSSTRKELVTVRVNNGIRTRIINVQF